jgi:hypothetical protein
MTKGRVPSDLAELLRGLLIFGALVALIVLAGTGWRSTRGEGGQPLEWDGDVAESVDQIVHDLP